MSDTIFKNYKLKEITSLLKKCNEKQLNQIEIILQSQELEEILNEILKNKQFDNETNIFIKNNIFNCESSFDDKLKFLKLLKNHSITEIPSSGNILDLIDKKLLKTNTFRFIFNNLVNYSGLKFNGKGSTSSGKLELFLLLFSNGTIPKTGDILLNNKSIEIKFGHSLLGFYGTRINDIKEKMKTIVQSFENNAKLIQMIEQTTKHSDFNLQAKNSTTRNILTELNDLNLQKTVITKLLSSVFKKHNISIENMFDNNELKQSKDINKILFDYIFEEYKKKQNFDYMCCVNPNTLDYCLVSSSKDLEKYDLRLDHFSWSGSRSQTLAISYKGTE